MPTFEQAARKDARGTSRSDGWFPRADDDRGEIMSAQLARAGAFLLKRRAYEIFAGHWPHVPDDNPVAVALDSLPKYVASTTLEWEDSDAARRGLHRGDRVRSRSCRGKAAGNSSARSWRTVFHRQAPAAGLPVALNYGRRLFDGLSVLPPARLADSRPPAGVGSP